ncbi:MAG: hypothetical protein EOP10_17640 [Proteobacteria bacterium]|nr:MAG: hypothetical protein EOP10_17640 [Pseudomonadota bacterium]
MNRFQTLSAAVLTLGFIACDKDDDDDKKGRSANLPLVKPPVQEAAPTGLQTGLVSTAAQGLSERFFNADGGPSNIFQLLTNIDNSIGDINRVTGTEEKACQTQTPVEYSITPSGESVTMFGQCYQNLEVGNVATVGGFTQFGVKDGTIYIYSSNAGNQSAVIISPIADKPTKYTVKAWFTVGASNAIWDSGSYGLMNLSANSDLKTFEFTVAGLGLGYCGAQLKSDNSDIFAQTSIDMGMTCNAVESVCAKGADISDSTTCSDAIKAFDLKSIGRVATQGNLQSFGASQYPLVPNLTFNGSSTDALRFGPTVPTSGVGNIGLAGTTTANGQ